MSFLLLKPFCRSVDVWGGDRMFRYYPDQIGIIPDIAEAWVLSVNEKGECTVEGGEYDKLTFAEALRRMGHESIGEDRPGDEFPLLIKLIDAKKDLSVQVHPNDEFARAHDQPRGKTEAWYIIDAESDSRLVYGLEDGVTPEELALDLAAENLEPDLRFTPVRPGDVAFIPAGTVHAIGKGIWLCEVQQNCDVTYRLYDYNRLDKKGKKRDLDVELGLGAIDHSPREFTLKPCGDTTHFANSEKTCLCRCEYFKMFRRRVFGRTEICPGRDSFLACTVVGGSGTVSDGERTVEISVGKQLFFPAGDEVYVLDGEFETVDTTL